MRKVFKGEVFTYDFGESDGNLYGGIRPVLAISSVKGKQFIVCPLTSELDKNNIITHVLLEKENYDFLDTDSIFLGEHIYTKLKDERLRVKLGKLSDEDLRRVESALESSLGLEASQSTFNSDRNYIKRGDIVEYVKNKEFKKGIVIQNNIANRFSNTIIVCELSGEVESKRYSEKLGEDYICKTYLDTVNKENIIHKVEKLDKDFIDYLVKDILKICNGEECSYV